MIRPFLLVIDVRGRAKKIPVMLTSTWEKKKNLEAAQVMKDTKTYHPLFIYS